VSIQEHIVYLEELSALDEEIRAVDDTLSTERSALAGKKEELARLEEKIASDEKSIAEMAKTRTDLVLEVRQVTALVEKSHEKLSRARNERETNAATRELEELRNIQKGHEEQIGKLQLLETEASKSKEEAEVARRALEDQLGTTEGVVSKRLAEAEQQKAQMLERRQGVVTKLPRPILSRYEMIRKRRGIAIAATHNGICEACHLAAPPQLFQKILRQETFEVCPHCQRILYFKPSDAESNKEER